MARTRIIEQGFDELQRRYAERMGDLGRRLVALGRSKAPVRRGYRSYDTSPGPLGGTLRDSITHAVALEGQIIESPPDTNGAGAPSWLGEEFHGGRDQLELIVYTNTAQSVNPLTGTAHDYGLFVHEGTSRMPARPFLTEALAEVDLKSELES